MVDHIGRQFFESYLNLFLVQFSHLQSFSLHVSLACRFGLWQLTLFPGSSHAFLSEKSLSKLHEFICPNRDILNSIFQGQDGHPTLFLFCTTVKFCFLPDLIFHMSIGDFLTPYGPLTLMQTSWVTLVLFLDFMNYLAVQKANVSFRSV